VLCDQADLIAALLAFRASLAISDHLTKAVPSNLSYQRDAAVTHSRIAHVLERQGIYKMQKWHLRTALAIAERLIEANPSNVDWHSLLTSLRAFKQGKKSRTRPRRR
jgi:hypothetical protein